MMYPFVVVTNLTLAFAATASATDKFFCPSDFDVWVSLQKEFFPGLPPNVIFVIESFYTINFGILLG